MSSATSPQGSRQHSLQDEASIAIQLPRTFRRRGNPSGYRPRKRYVCFCRLQTVCLKNEDISCSRGRSSDSRRVNTAGPGPILFSQTSCSYSCTLPTQISMKCLKMTPSIATEVACDWCPQVKSRSRQDDLVTHPRRCAANDRRSTPRIQGRGVYLPPTCAWCPRYHTPSHNFTVASKTRKHLPHLRTSDLERNEQR